MGIRRIKRQIAKAHLRAVGVGNVNKKLSMEKDGVKVWRLALMDRAATKRKPARKQRRHVRKVEQVSA